MQVYYANASFRKNDFRGRNIHIRQFIEKSTALGHTLWMEASSEHPAVKHMPDGKLARLAAYRQMDVIYIRLQETTHQTCRLGLFPFRALIGSPTIVWEFNTIPEFTDIVHPQSGQLQSIQKDFIRLAPGCDLAVCVSEKIQTYVRSIFQIKHTIVIPNGSDPELFKSKSELSPKLTAYPEKIRVVWIGSANLAWNDFDVLLEAIQRINQNGNGQLFEFHIIGKDFPTPKYSADNLIFHGPIEYLELPAWLASMDIGLVLYHPGSADYNSPLKLFDYLSSELAVVSSAQPQTAQILAQIGASDLVLAANDPGELAAKLIELSGQPERLKRLGQAGRQLILEKYNWKKAVADTYQAISALENGNHG